MDIYMPYSGRQLLQYMNGQRSDDAASFDALGKLELHGKCAYEGLSPFNLSRWFPNLKQLTVAHPDLWLYSDDELLPCNLHELSFTVHQQVIDYDRWFRRNPTLVKLELQCDGVPALEAMCTYGLHDTLQSLSILVCQKFDFYNEWMAFCRVLGKFEQLKSLSIEFRYCGMMIGFAEALIGMRKLESLRLKGCSDEPENEIQFLTSLAANAPPHLKLFEVEEALMCIYRSEWDEFVEAMPKTECLHAAPFREDFEHRHWFGLCWYLLFMDHDEKFDFNDKSFTIIDHGFIPDSDIRDYEE